MSPIAFIFNVSIVVVAVAAEVMVVVVVVVVVEPVAVVVVVEISTVNSGTAIDVFTVLPSFAVVRTLTFCHHPQSSRVALKLFVFWFPSSKKCSSDAISMARQCGQTGSRGGSRTPGSWP